MKSKNDVTRRKFLQTAAGASLVAGVAAVAIPLSARAETGPVTVPAPPRPEHPLEAILSRYGSELGHLKQTR